MTIEEMAEKWANSKCPVSPASQTIELDEFMNRMYKEQYIEIATEVLSSLLEDLPEVEEQEERSLVTDYRISGENIYREKIKLLIQTKLK